MPNIYDVASAIQQPNIVGNIQAGQQFAQQNQARQMQLQQAQKQQEDQSQLRNLAPQIISGDPNAYAQAAAIDPQAAQQYQGAGDDQLKRIQGAISYIDQQQSPQAKEAAYQQVRPYLARFGQEPPATFAEAEPKMEAARAQIAMLGQQGGDQYVNVPAQGAVFDKQLGKVVYQNPGAGPKEPDAVATARAFQENPDLLGVYQKMHPRATSSGSLSTSLGKAPSGYRWKGDGSGLEPIPGGPADSSGTGQGLTTDAIDNSAWTYIATGKLPAVGRGKEGVAQRTAVMNHAAQIAKDAGIPSSELQTVPGRNKALQSSLTNLQKLSDVMEKSEQGFQNNTQTALELSNKVDRTGSPVLNKWILGGKAAMGDPDVQALDAAINTMAVDYARIMSGATGAGGTPISTAEEAKSMIKKELSDKSLRAVVDVLNRDIAGQQSAVHNQRGKILGAMQSMHDEAAPEAKAAKGNVPQQGEVQDGYVFHGGDPADPNNWEKL